ncbi:solute carrier family 40 member 1-like protein [Corchorus olitorius]|uniref:Solute carrier family 40 member 1-like protein n=1 Tax=Corchorus olitorius TaxID=93759 RepID=A0A1R3HHV4_9ROSI|nr:solute carrier family 40 member 1-like protein [Corchorus olitorius]
MDSQPLLEQQTAVQGPPSSLFNYLYTAHFLARWGTRSQFEGLKGKIVANFVSGDFTFV